MIEQPRTAESASEVDLPRSVVGALSVGHGGMSILINVVAFLLVYFYLPPDTAGLPPLVTDTTFLAVLNAVVLVAAAGRLTDAITDPLIATWSDRSTHRLGRRIPFMRVGALPAALATLLLFVPPIGHVSAWNIVWLLGVQVLLYVAITAYVTPAFSLVADLGRTPRQRLDLATWTTVAWAVGIMFSATTPFLADILDGATIAGSTISTIRAWQYSIGLVCFIGFVAMMVPVFAIDEPRYSRSEPTTVPLRESLKRVTANPFFRFYLAADFAYFCGLTVIQTGLLYYVTVLLELDETITAPLLLLMVVLAMALYPVVNKMARHRSARKMVVVAFALSAADFAFIGFLGMVPLPNWLQAVGMVVIFSVPFAILSLLPGWILSDIAEHSALTTGEATAAMFFAARTFIQKVSQTFGVVLFALLISLGRDVGDDLGVRLSGLAGVIMYAAAAILFSRYDEDRLRRELAEPTLTPTLMGPSPSDTPAN